METYKRLIKDQSMRMRILKAFEWVPDSVMIRIQYLIKMGKMLDLKAPKTFTEKIQWYKLFYRDPIMTICVDKHAVKQYLKEKGMSKYIIPELGVWNNSKEIDWEELPKSFILKTTNGSETNIFVKDKDNVDRNWVCKQLDEWMSQTFISPGREWAYNNVVPRIICEPILNDKNQHGNGLDDYKFFCFNGKIEMMWIDYDRFQDHKRVLFTPDGNRLNVQCTYNSPHDFKYPKQAFERLIPVVNSLSSGFPHVRVDMYYIENRPIFGEMTFYSGSGYEPFSDEKYDKYLGDLFNLPVKKVN